MSGWIKIHRSILEWEWWDEEGMLKLFLYLLMEANHEVKKWKGIEVKRGQLITSPDKLTVPSSLTVKQVRLRLKKLEETGEILTKTTNKYTLITICKYEKYQGVESEEGQTKDKQGANKRQTEGNQTANESQSKDKQRATTKELKNIRIKEYSIHIGGEEKILSENLFVAYSEIISNENYLHGIYRNSPVKDLELLKSKWLPEFLVVLEMRGDTEKSIQEIISHFANWLLEQHEKTIAPVKQTTHPAGGNSKMQSTMQAIQESLTPQPQQA